MDPFTSNATILVTGAAGRLGQVVVRQLLPSAVVAGIDQRNPGIDADSFHFVEGDLTDEAAAARAFEAVTARVDAVDAVLHTVGMWGGAPLAETTQEDFESILRVNLTSTFLCFREAIRQWRAHDRGGHLVAIASMQGADRGAAQQAAYSASKAGVIRLVESTAAEFREAGITAAAVAPSMILFGNEAPGTAGIPVERVARLCTYLASEGATVHNGSVLRAYGTMLG